MLRMINSGGALATYYVASDCTVDIVNATAPVYLYYSVFNK